MRTNLPLSAWGARSITCSYAYSSEAHYHLIFPTQQLVTGYESSISYLCVLGCAIYVPITQPQRIQMGPHRRMSIYVGCESPTIHRYIVPLSGDLFVASMRQSSRHQGEIRTSTLSKNDENCRGLSPLCLIMIPLLHIRAQYYKSLESRRFSSGRFLRSC